ncbi:hypothetical protein [Streptomyces sp. NPDC051576]|uniref:hypothetical protein n=1 Tax=Streptomyces sp. NPDC051576 TaxID=3155803 RepID=UPI003425CED7
MPRRIRFTRRPAPLVAVLAAVLGLLSTPAAADGSDKVALRLEAPAAFLMYHADEGAEAANSDFVVPVAVVRSDGGPAHNVRVVVDTAGLRGVATAGKGGYGNCTGKNRVFTCEYGDVQNGDGEANAPFTLHGVDGVEPGDSGTVTYTVTADNAAPVTGTTRMTVGGPTLHTPGKTKTVRGVAPGASVPLTPQFANRTRFTAERGVALKVNAGDGLRLKSRPENCWFDSDATVAWCRFNFRAAPHTAYATSSPITYTAGPGELGGSLSYTWSSEPERPDDLTVRGTDALLTLRELTGAAARELTGATGSVSVETTVQADYEPVTATVRGRVGDTVRVRLGLRDLGPGRLESGESMGGFEVVPPEGTTVTSIPYVFEGDGSEWACARPKRRGGPYVCDIGSDDFYEVRHEGGTTAIAFHIRIDRQVPGAQGTIRTYNPYDRTPGNDTAAIPLDASPAPLYRRHLVPLLVGVAMLAIALAVVMYRRRRGV